ncbi:MAG: MerR family transcriptional regulator [Bdellovibrionaceae bacterium]|nr:MerR family transcriptional regulator [Pseudobdellovibrionaceae bacterium]
MVKTSRGSVMTIETAVEGAIENVAGTDEKEAALKEALGKALTVSSESGIESLSDVDQLELIPFQMRDHDFVEVAPSDSLERDLSSIPEQMAFKIGTAADLVGVKPYVLRFWETEFDALKPKKSQKGQRAYSRRDVETAMMIKKLLYEDRFSIEGARSKIKELRSKVKGVREDRAELEKMREEVKHRVDEVRSVALTEMKALLGDISRFRALFSA